MGSPMGMTSTVVDAQRGVGGHRGDEAIGIVERVVHRQDGAIDLARVSVLGGTVLFEHAELVGHLVG